MTSRLEPKLLTSISTTTPSILTTKLPELKLESPLNLGGDLFSKPQETPDLNCKLLSTTRISTEKKSQMHSKAVVLKRPIRYIDEYDGQIANNFEPYERKKLKFEIPQPLVKPFGEPFVTDFGSLDKLTLPELWVETKSHDTDPDWRIVLINKVNMCLIQRIDFSHISGGRDQAKIMEFRKVAEKLLDDKKTAEFVIQIALYARRGLNIRTAANYLIGIS